MSVETQQSSSRLNTKTAILTAFSTDLSFINVISPLTANPNNYISWIIHFNIKFQYQIFQVNRIHTEGKYS